MFYRHLRFRSLWLLFGLAPAIGYAQPSAGPIVKTHAGKVQGVQEGPLRVFRGIPYAQAPVGPLRFRPPQPLKKHKGVATATSFGARATQAGGPTGVQGSEDCLYLNVWAPNLPPKRGNRWWYGCTAGPSPAARGRIMIPGPLPRRIPLWP